MRDSRSTPSVLPWAVVAIILLIAGVIVGRGLVPEPAPTSAPQPAPEKGFRDWFWERRTLDMLAQVGLVFAGSLGVAALLPGRDETDERALRPDR